MRNRLAILAFLASALLAACGNNGSTASGGGGVNPPAPTPAPTTAPTAAPSTAPQGNLPLSETVAGSAAWVDPSTHRTLYFLSVDTSTGSACTAGCTAIWPPLVPSANAQASGNMTIITRSDGTGKQWAYQGHPLYMFSGDNGPDQSHGEGVMDFGGTWHIARPSASNPTPAPGGGTPPPCTGPYC